MNNSFIPTLRSQYKPTGVSLQVMSRAPSSLPAADPACRAGDAVTTRREIASRWISAASAAETTRRAQDAMVSLTQERSTTGRPLSPPPSPLLCPPLFPSLSSPLLYSLPLPLLSSPLLSSPPPPTGADAVFSCGVCGGDSKSCTGCDGVINSGKQYDRCGVCDGNNRNVRHTSPPSFLHLFPLPLLLSSLPHLLLRWTSADAAIRLPPAASRTPMTSSAIPSARGEAIPAEAATELSIQ
eukprot:751415-Hanusia_phi.AAC.1